MSACLLLGACAADERRDNRAEEAILKREIQGLAELAEAAETGNLVSPRSLVIGIREDVISELVSSNLPQEFVIQGLRIEINHVDVSFQSSLGLVTLRGRATRSNAPGDFADFICSGGLSTPEIHPGGRLSSRIAVDRLHIPDVAAGGQSNRLLRTAVDTLNQQILKTLRDDLPPVEIPVRLEERIALEGLASGPVQLRSGEVPLKATVARVFPLQGRLWILVDIATGRWQPGAIR